MEPTNHVRPDLIDTDAMSRVRGVIFDVDGTLYDQRSLRRRMAVRLARAYWFKPAQGIRILRALEAYRQAHEELRELPFSSRLQFDLAVKKCGHPATEVQAIVDRWFKSAPLAILPHCVYPGVLELLPLLRGLDVACGVFSDYPPDEKLSAMGLSDFFTCLRCAEDVGRQKPDPAGLLDVAQAMGLVPDEVLYIGDRDIDMEAATRAGMHGSLVRSNDDWQSLCVSFKSRGRS